MKILIVEDNALTSEVLGELLRLDGHEITHVGTGAELFALLPNDPPDAIVLDFVLPDLDGLSVLAEIRRRDKWRDIPVVLASAAVIEVVEGTPGTPLALLRKPFDSNKLLEAIAVAKGRK